MNMLYLNYSQLGAGWQTGIWQCSLSRCRLAPMEERYTPVDYLAIILLFALALVFALLMATYVTERLPHLEDEIAYLFQARTFARGQLWAPPPPVKRVFFTPFVLTLENGRRVGKYGIGWPLVLALGERFNIGWLVNPLLGAVTVGLVYALGRDLYNRQTGIAAGLLACTSPFFLIQSSTYMSHAAACFWAALLTWAFLRSEDASRHQRVWAALAGMALGMLTLTRSLTALSVGLPFILALMVHTLRRPGKTLQAYWPMALVAVLVAAWQPLYLYLVTGSPTTNLYTMVWAYDRVGFGPGFGLGEGHTLRQALITARQDLVLWSSELFGWRYASWVPLIPGLIAGWRASPPGKKYRVLLLVGPFVSLVVLHLAYWIGAKVYGPRYYYEGHAGLSVLAALGLIEVAKLVAGGVRKIRKQTESPSRQTRITFSLLVALITLNALTYLPARLNDWRGLYDITREPLDKLAELQETERVLVIVRGGHWIEYAEFFAFNSPWYDDPVVAAHDIDQDYTSRLIAHFSDREVWFYKDGEFSRQPFPYDDP